MSQAGSTSRAGFRHEAMLYASDDALLAGGWRERLDAMARANWELFVRHPWALHLATGRPPLGPNVMRKYEVELRAVDGLGLTEVEMDLLVTLVNGFVRGSVTGVHEKADAERATGITEAQWWAATEPYVAAVFDAAHRSATWEGGAPGISR